MVWVFLDDIPSFTPFQYIYGDDVSFNVRLMLSTNLSIIFLIVIKPDSIRIKLTWKNKKIFEILIFYMKKIKNSL